MGGGRRERIEEIRVEFEQLDDVPLSQRPALFEELNRLLAEELAELEEV